MMFEPLMSENPSSTLSSPFILPDSLICLKSIFVIPAWEADVYETSKSTEFVYAPFPL